MIEREITVVELMTAKDYLERGIAILNKCGCVIAEDIQENIDQINKMIGEL